MVGARRSVSIFKLKKRAGPHDLEISMTGIKLGSNVLQISRSDGGFAAALAGIVGLSGRACSVVKTEAEADRFRRAAAAAGVLLEIQVALPGEFPYDQESFDVVVIKNAIGEMVVNARVVCLQQAYRVLRSGGRCVVIEKAIRAGLGALFSKRALDRRYVDDGGAQAALKAEGFRGVRLLAERDGVSFTEGTK